MERREVLKWFARSSALLPGLLTGCLSDSGYHRPPPVCAAGEPIEGRRYNVVFLAVDDLRPQLGAYGASRVVSPHIDRLASEGMLFERAYCQQPVCMASRASLMSGYRPNHAGIHTNAPLRDLLPNAPTLDRHFEQHGYDIWATGKIYHHALDSRERFGARWREPVGGRGYLTDDARAIRAAHGVGPAFESAEVADDAYADGKRADLAIARLGKYRASGWPFFLAVGFHKPHLPFNAPRRYWDLYPPDDTELASNPFPPHGAPFLARYDFGELRRYHGIPGAGEPLPDALARQLVRGYHACVSYIDAQVGRIIGALDRLGLRQDTIVVLWGDHGWKLGEHGMWSKHTPFELDARVPLIISVPGMRHAGARTSSLTEFVDIYPTLCELCGLPLPDHLQGDSAVPVLADPGCFRKVAAFTQQPKYHPHDPLRRITAHSLRTDRYRYTEWTQEHLGAVLARELYDHAADGEENANLADLPENRALVAGLSGLLAGGEGWRSLRPERDG